MTYREFFYLVADLRACQRNYFKTRTPAALRAARAREDALDAIIAELKMQDRAARATEDALDKPGYS